MKKITTLEELYKEKKKLKMEMEVTKRAVAHSFGTSRTNLKSLFLKNIVAPAGIAGLAYTGIKAFSSSNSNNKQNSAKNSATSQLITKLLPLIISAVQAYFVKQKAEEIKEPLEENMTPTRHHSPKNGVLVNA